MLRMATHTNHQNRTNMITRETPAPIDEKNVVTDWIDDVFDDKFSIHSSDGKYYVGTLRDIPLVARVCYNSILWETPYGSVSDLAGLHEDLLDLDLEGEGMKITYHLRDNRLVQSFYFEETIM